MEITTVYSLLSSEFSPRKKGQRRDAFFSVHERAVSSPESVRLLGKCAGLSPDGLRNVVWEAYAVTMEDGTVVPCASLGFGGRSGGYVMSQEMGFKAKASK
jgi:hypothetical protein